MKALFVNNKIKIIGTNLSQDDKILYVWKQLKIDYSNWVKKFKSSKIDSIPVTTVFEWKGMSTWWISPLSKKDNYDNDLWFKRMMVLYLCKEFPKMKIITDDVKIIKSVLKNFPEQTIEFSLSNAKNFKSFLKRRFNFIYKTAKLIDSFLGNFLIIIIMKLIVQKNTINLNNRSVWFKTIYPANWIQIESNTKNNYIDRNLLTTPYEGRKHGFSENYLVFYQSYKQSYFKSSLNVRHYVKKLLALKKANFAFAQSYLKISDFIGVYITSFKEYCLLKKFSNNKNLFVINNINFYDILIDEWKSSYFGDIQFNKLYGLSTSSFFSNVKKNDIFVTYGEFLSDEKASYHLIETKAKNVITVGLQHGYNPENKLFLNLHKSDFNKNNYLKDNINYSPKPNYFFSQGEQYNSTVENALPKQNSKIIGSLKYDHFDKLRKNKVALRKKYSKILNLSNKKILLILTSISDYTFIIDFFTEWEKFSNWKILLCPHPATDLIEIKNYISKKHPKLEIKFIKNISSYNLIPISNLVVTGYSVTAIEALYFNVQSIRLYDIGTFPIFDNEKLIPVFYRNSDFIKWINNYDSSYNKDLHIEQLNLVKKYFYLLDGHAKDRLWNNIQSLDKNISGLAN